MKSWLKGGLIFGVIYFLICIIVGIIYLFDFNPFIVLVLAYFIIFPISYFINLGISFITIIINLIFWFIIGALIGWLIGKINKKV